MSGVNNILKREFDYLMENDELSDWAINNLPPSEQQNIILAKEAKEDGDILSDNFKDLI